MALRAPAIGAEASDPAASDALTFSSRTRLLVIAPHPDDETIAAGLLIQRVRAAGGAVKILLLTAGDNNPWPQRWVERRARIGQQDRLRWGRRRSGELQAALQRLDVAPDSLQAMGWPDMRLTDVLCTRHGEAIAALAGVIGAFQPGIIALPALADRHPDHGAAHVLARLALAGQAAAPILLSYLIHGRVAAAEPIQVAGTAAQSAAKLYALAAHRSQMALSGKRMRRLASAPERYAALPRHVPMPGTALPWQPPVWLQSRLQISLADRAGVQSWRWAAAPLRRADDGVYHLAPAAGDNVGPRFARLACDLPSPWIFDHWGWCEL